MNTLQKCGHRVGLSGAGDAQQAELLGAAFESADQAFDGLRLIAGRTVIGDQLKRTGV